MSSVSVIITNHNYADYLDAAIESAVAQRETGLDVQVVVVDDGSTDGSADVLERWDERVEVVRRPNGGQAAAFNTGFERATGEIVFFLDADDLLLPGAASVVVDAFGAAPSANRVNFPLVRIDAGGRPLGGTIPDDPADLPDGSMLSRLLRAPDDIPWQPTSGNAFRAEGLRRILPMPEAPYRTCADHYLSNLGALDGEVTAVARPLGSYRIHGRNADHRDGLDLDRIAAIVDRTIVTHEALHRAARDRGLAFPEDPRGVPSVTFLASRLLLRRLRDADEGSIASLVLQGTAAAGRRLDAPIRRRAAMAAWFVAAAVAPPPVLRRLGALALRR